MALVNPYCTVDQVKAEIKNSASTLTTVIEQAINSASRYIDDYKGRDYFQHEFVTLSPLKIYAQSKAVFGDQLYPPYLPIIGSTALVVKEGATTLTENTDFIRFSDSLMRVGMNWTVDDTPDGCITITGKFGYSQSSASAIPSNLPANIMLACIQIAAGLCGSNKIDAVSPDGTRTTVYTNGIPKEALKLLGSRKIFL